MSLFDLLFPEWAQAAHLRTLTEQNQLQQTQSRLAQARAEQKARASRKSLENRIEHLEQELGQASLIIQALIEKLDTEDICSREEMMSLVQEIDARDGVMDGRITPEKNQPFQSNRDWEEAKKPNFHFPDQ